MVEKSTAVTKLDLGFSLESSHLNQITDDDYEILTEKSGNHFIKLSQLRGVALIEATPRNDNLWGVRLDFPESRTGYLKLWYQDEVIAREVHDGLLAIKREDLERITLIRKKNAERKLALETEIKDKAQALKTAETPAPLKRQTGGRIKHYLQRLFKKA